MQLLKKKRGRPKSVKPINSDYLDVAETAKLLKISKSHVYSLTSNRKIPYIKFLGKKLLFERKEINEWLMSKKVKAKKR